MSICSVLDNAKYEELKLSERIRQRIEIFFSRPRGLNYGTGKCFRLERNKTKRGWKTALLGDILKMSTPEQQVEKRKAKRAIREAYFKTFLIS